MSNAISHNLALNVSKRNNKIVEHRRRFDIRIRSQITIHYGFYDFVTTDEPQTRSFTNALVT